MQATRREEGSQPAARGPASRQGSGAGGGGATGAVNSTTSNGKQAAGAAAVAPAGAGGLQPLQQKLQQHIDREDRRIKELTEAILYDFLPRALRAAAGGDDLSRELTPEKCRAVAGAALAVAALMNAPPGFLEFLLCVPWSTLGQLYPSHFDLTGGAGGGDKAAGAGSGAPPAPTSFFDWSATAASLGLEGSLPSSPTAPTAPPPLGPGAAGKAASAGAGTSLPQLEVSKEERAAIVNLPLDPALLDCVLGFLLRPEQAESLPPMMRLAPGDPLGDGLQAQAPVHGDHASSARDHVAALLDGATSLHCAAIRGNPAQVDHLLLCGADPLATNAAGEMPVENVPVCGDRCIGGKLSCRCMAPRDQEAWECRSRLARTLILRRCIVSWGRRGFSAWLRVVALCLLCLLGLWGHHAALRRPALDAQVATRRERRRQAALQRAQATLLKMRTNVSSGREVLAAAPAEGGGGNGALDPGEKQRAGPEKKQNGSGGGRAGGEAGKGGHAGCMGSSGSGGGLLLSEAAEQAGGSYRLVSGGGAEACRSAPGAFDRAERGYACFTAAVDLLQTLDLGGGVTPRGVAEVGGTDSPSFLVSEEEQAAIYAGWAEAALAKFRACGCTGCASLALHTAMAAHRQLAALFACVDRRLPASGAAKATRAEGPKPRLRPSSRQSSGSAGGAAAEAGGGGGVASTTAGPGESGLAGEGSSGDSWQRVGCHLATAIHVSMCVLLGTDVRQSATRAGVWRAQQCLQEWGRLRRLGLTEERGGDECLEAECLESWCRSAAADLVLAEALRGAPVAPRQPLAEVLPLAVQYDMQTGAPSLNRPVSREVVAQLEEALGLARPYASQHVLKVADAVARQMQEEIAAGDRLRELLQPRSGSGGAAGGGGGVGLVEQLSEAIAAAERFPNLQSEVEQARGLKERWIRRAEAQAQLDAVIDEVAGPAPEGLLSKPPGGGAPVVDADAFWHELNTRLARLEAAAETARQANIGVSRAKRVLKELAGQGAAVEAAARLDEALAGDKGGSGAIKSALAKAEVALAGASGGAGAACAFHLGLELLAPRIQAARQKLEVERAAEGLVRAVACCKGVGDLPRLEAAILAVRKLAAQDIHPEAYRAASDLRTRLEAASRARSTLEAALRGLQKHARQEDVDAVERAVEEAGACGDLLAPECGRAREAVHRWRSAAASEAKLTKALREGAGTQTLSRVIKEAAASGVKVGEARRLLKVMQGLEAAVQAAIEGPFQYQALKAKIEAAEAGGAPPGQLDAARATMQRLLLREVRAELDAVLKSERNKTDKSVTQRLSALKAVLDKADTVLSMERELAQHAQHQGAGAGEGPAGRPRAPGSPRGPGPSSSAASHSLQEAQDAWEEATATSAYSGAAGGAQEGGSGVPLSPRPLSRTTTGASMVTSEGVGEGGEPSSQATASASEEAPSPGQGAVSGEASAATAAAEEASSGAAALPPLEAAAASAAAPCPASQEPSASAKAAAAAPEESTALAAAAAGPGGDEAEPPAEPSETAGPRQLPPLSVPPPTLPSRPGSEASTPTTSYSTPADSPDGTEQLDQASGAGVAAGEGEVVLLAAARGDETGEAAAAGEPAGAGAASPRPAAEPPSPSGSDDEGRTAGPLALEGAAGGEPSKPSGPEAAGTLASAESPGEGTPAAEVASASEDEAAELDEADDLAAVIRLVRRARRQLVREEAEQARIERERAEDARIRREAQAQLKAERERADKERAEKAKAERAERRAAQEAAKAERRERERQQRLEKEREREGRERAAREHFAALQRQRRAAAQQAAAAQAAVQHQQNLLLQSPQLKMPMAAGAGSLLLSSPRAALHPHPPPQLPPHAAAMLDAAQQAQHARADSLEMLSVKTGLLDLLNDYPGEGEPGRAPAGAGNLQTARLLHSSESSLLSPSSTGTAGEAWEASLATGGGDATSGLLGAAGARWPSGDNVSATLGSSLAGSEQGLGASMLPPDWSPARLGGPAGGGRIRFSDLGGASWLAEGGAGPAVASTQGLDTSTIPTSSGLGLAATGGGRLAGSGGSLGLGSGGGLWDAGMGAGGVSQLGAPLPGLATRDDLALLAQAGGEASGSIWQSAGGGGGDGWGGGMGLASLEAAATGAAAAGGMLSPARSGGGGAGLSQQQARQQQLIAAIDAAKAQVQISQLAAAAAAAQQQQQQQRVCKYFLQGFCREGMKCRYAHTTSGMGAGGLGGLGPLSPRLPGQAPDRPGFSAFQAGRLGPQSSHMQPPPLSLPMVGLGGATGGGGSGEASTGGGAVSSFAFGAPGSLAFGAPNSAPVSRSPTPDMRAVQQQQPSALLASPLGGGMSLPPASAAPLGGGGGGSSAFGPSLGTLFGAGSPATERPGSAGGGVAAASSGALAVVEEVGAVDAGAESDHDNYGLPSEASLFSDLLPEA